MTNHALSSPTPHSAALRSEPSPPVLRSARDHVLERVRDACERYDWDGVELDWQRHAFHLPDADAFRRVLCRASPR